MRPFNKGKKCRRFRKVRVKGQGMALRCAKGGFKAKKSKSTGAKRRKGVRRCKFGVVKTGPRKGKCRKIRRAR